MINIVENRDLIKEIFREVINEVILEERINIYHSIIPIASEQEVNDIEKLYDKPDNYNKEDFVDIEIH